MDQVVRVLGVVLLQQTVRCEGVVDAVAHHVAQFGLGQAAVQGQRTDEDDVVDPRLGGQVEDLLDHQLAGVGTAHRGQRQRHVVEGDREPHPRPQQRRQRLGVAVRVEQGVADGADRIGERVERFGRVQHPTACRQRLEVEALAVPEQGGRGGSVDLEDESRSRAHEASPFRRRGCISKTTFTAPRLPAPPAWATASSKRSRG